MLRILKAYWLPLLGRFAACAGTLAPFAAFRAEELSVQKPLKGLMGRMQGMCDHVWVFGLIGIPNMRAPFWGRPAYGERFRA